VCLAGLQCIAGIIAVPSTIPWVYFMLNSGLCFTIAAKSNFAGVLPFLWDCTAVLNIYVTVSVGRVQPSVIHLQQYFENPVTSESLGLRAVSVNRNSK
jgi:hypothetical protein